MTTRTDAPFVGIISPNTEIFTMGLSDSKNPNLYYWACYSLATGEIVFGAGLLGNGINGIIDSDFRPIYFSYSDYDNESVILIAYSDVNGDHILGNVTLIAIPGYVSLLVSNDLQPSAISLTTEDPSMNENRRLLYGVRYKTTTIQSTIIPCLPNTGEFQGICTGFNVPFILTPDVIERINGVVTVPIIGPDIDIDNYDPLMQLFNTYYYLSQPITNMYINFIPVRYYRVENCSLSEELSGYLPNTMIIAQCYLSPNSPFGLSSICDIRGGLTDISDCNNIGFNYYYAYNQCGEAYQFNDMNNQVIDVTSSKGYCNNQCEWDPSLESFVCTELTEVSDVPNSSAARVNESNKVESTNLTSRLGLLSWLIIFAIMIIIVIAIIIIVVQLDK